MWIARSLGLPATIPLTVQLSILFYLAHILCEGWIGSSQGFLALSILAALIAIARRQLRVRYHPLYVPLLLFLLASTVSALASSHPGASLLEVGEWFSFLTFPLALTLHRSVPRTIRLTVICLLILGLFQSLYGLGQYYLLGRRELENRITGTAAHVMTYSGLLLPVALLSLLMALQKRSRLAMGTAVATSLSLLLTFTRGAWVGWLAGFITFLSLRRTRWLAYSAPVLVVAITFSPLPLFGRLISSFDLRQSSNLDRIRMIQAGVEIIKDYPFFGAGPANIKEIYPLYREPDAPRFRIPHLHNNIVQIWAERGLLAVSAYALLIGYFLVLCARAPREDPERRLFADAGLATAVALLFAGLFEFNFGDSEVLILMLDVFALVCAVLERASNDPTAAAVVG